MSNNVTNILMKRDNISFSEAKTLVEEALEAVLEKINDGDLFCAEDAWTEATGLESDYLLDLI